MDDQLEVPSFKSRIVALITELLAPYPAGTARIELPPDRGTNCFVEVVPRNPNAATIHLHFYPDGGLVDFCFGNMCSPFELDGDDCMDRLRQLSEAVIEGRCGEAQGLIGRKSWLTPRGSNGRIGSSIFFYPTLLPRKQQFAPY